MYDVGSDFKCPRCKSDLKPHGTPLGKVWICDACKGQAVGLALLRQSFTEESIALLWTNAVEGNGNRVCECPACQKPMQEVSASSDLRVDVCCRCHFVWLDAGEIERFARRSPPSEPAGLPDKAQEILGNALIEQMKLKAESETAAELFRNARYLMYGYPFGYFFRLLWKLRK